MKRTFLAVSVSLGFLTFTNFASAQDEELPTPTAPYIAPVPDYGHWMVTLKYTNSAAPAKATSNPAQPPTPTTPPTQTAAPAPAAAPDGFPTTIDTIKTGDLRGVVLTFANGTSKQYTCQGDWVLSSTPKGPQLSIANPTAAPYIYYSTGFILLDGVKVDLSTFRETGKHNGVMAFHYKSGDTDVWIDPKSMLPLAAKQTGVEVSYQFLNPPPRPFPIPKDQESLLHQEVQAYQQTKAQR